ncbi:MGH1-like glycoside hydrolase domain-containing protein [Rathayibacter sp. CAU 1779]
MPVPGPTDVVDGVADRRREFLASAPHFDSDDDLLNTVFARRWESFAANLVRTDRGWLVTEFHQPGPGRAHGTVNAAAGHHIMEGRWLGDPQLIDDYVRFWYTAPEAEPHRYTEWIAWAAVESARLQDRWDVVSPLLSGMAHNFEAWHENLHPSGLYWAHDLADAMEFSISGDGLRPTINAYLYGNAAAISELATRTGDAALSHRFSEISDGLARRIVDDLYDPELGLFVTLPLGSLDDDAYLREASAERRMPSALSAVRPPSARQVVPARRVRELAGFVPWYFGITDDRIDAAGAVHQLADPDGFFGSYGLRTAEARHPRYRFAVASDLPRFLCRWNGPTWPFATSQVLTALSGLARQGRRDEHGELFVRLLRQYASSHLERDGEYRLDEDIDPDRGGWLTRAYRLEHEPERADIGRDYQHSTFADLVLSGLMGISHRDGVLRVDPLPAIRALGRVHVSNLRIARHDVDVTCDPATGMRLTVDRIVTARADIGALEVLVRGQAAGG